MKNYSQILALCALPVLGSAFVVQPSKANSQPLTYLSSLGGYGTETTEKSGYSYPQATNGSYNSDAERAQSLKIAGGKAASAPSRGSMDMKGNIKNIWDTLSPVTVQGGSLRTWSFATPAIERVQVMLKSDGRPLHANVELWQGPDNTPVKMSIYNEDGSLRPFSAVIETPRGQNAIAIRNTGQMEFPLAACVEADLGDNGSSGLGAVTQKLAEIGTQKTIQGGAVHTYPFDPSVASVQLMLKTDGRPLNARIELLQGPNNNKQVIDLYCEDGMERPFFAVIETPGSGNVVRIVNTASMEFPMTARVEPYLMEQNSPGTAGGDYFILDRQW